jgi:hypothetical protein
MFTDFTDFKNRVFLWKFPAQERAEKAKYKLKRTVSPPSYQDVLEAKSEGKITLQKPLTGYKKIVCETSPLKFDIFLAQITAPTGANVVRSRRYWWGKKVESMPSPKMRTDKHVINKIFINQPFVKCFSRHDSKMVYVEGQTYNADKLDLDLDVEHTYGLHFYGNQIDATDEN